MRAGRRFRYYENDYPGRVDRPSTVRQEAELSAIRAPCDVQPPESKARHAVVAEERPVAQQLGRELPELGVSLHAEAKLVRRVLGRIAGHPRRVRDDVAEVTKCQHLVSEAGGQVARQI